ncbi:MAG: hypothetical protein JHC95_08170 [Solirubrobacteraceae bacterium]|nr:hypothetical protein [Solirubrobacteraceae bacterium]
MDLEDLRVTIYERFASSGSRPSAAWLGRILRASEDEVLDGLRALADARHVALDDRGEIVMAHPFSAVPLGFSVMGPSTLWWGGCAWDAFAMPFLLPDLPDALVATRCPGCDAALAWVVRTDAPPEGSEVAHFVVPMARCWDDVVHTCGHQRLFCSEACVDACLAASGNARGYVMDLATLWRLASDWYTGRLDPGYVRREPAEAKAYFASAGLSGPFWGLGTD